MVKELNLQNIEKEKELNLSEKVEESHEFIKQVKEGRIKLKELKIPRKAKVRRSKLKKGWIGLLTIEENGNLTGEKTKITGSAFNRKEGTYHATDGREILFWNGKFPVIIQQSWKKNPMNLRMKKDEINETYGDPYIKAKILKDVIKVKKSGGGIIIWILVAAGLYLGYQFLSGGI